MRSCHCCRRNLFYEYRKQTTVRCYHTANFFWPTFTFVLIYAKLNRQATYDPFGLPQPISVPAALEILGV